MILNLEHLKKYNKLLNSFSSSAIDDFFYFDLENNYLYFSNNLIALKLKIEVSEVEPSFKMFMVPKQEFLHLLSCFSTITINTDYSYQTIETKGKFHKNEKLLSTIDSIKSIFNYNTIDYKKYLDITEDILHKIAKATIFTNVDDKNLQSRCVHFDGSTIMSSSLNRIYINSCQLDSESIITQNIIKYMFMLDSLSSLSLYKKDKTILLKDTDLELLFVGIENVDLLSMKEEKMESLKNNIFEGKKIRIETKELINKLEFIKFYSMSKNNNMTHLILKNGQLKFEVDETNVLVKLITCNTNSIDFYFNSFVLLEIVLKLAKEKEYIDIYTLDNILVYIVSLDIEENKEFVFISKINV